MTEKEKAKELVEHFAETIPEIVVASNISGALMERDWETAKQCALICVDEKIEVLEKLRKPEYTIFIEWEQLKTKEEADTMDGYEYIDFLKKVKTEIENINP